MPESTVFVLTSVNTASVAVARMMMDPMNCVWGCRSGSTDLGAPVAGTDLETDGQPLSRVQSAGHLEPCRGRTNQRLQLIDGK